MTFLSHPPVPDGSPSFITSHSKSLNQSTFKSEHTNETSNPDKLSITL